MKSNLATPNPSEAPAPLEIPADFDPERGMMVRTEDTGVYHASRLSAEFAARLVANGTPQDLSLAEKVLDGVEACQERCPEDPHYGNYRWEFEDAEVEDLNAVHFVLIEIIPMLAQYGDRLTAPCRQRVETSLRLALSAIARLDVGLEYTNIVLKDITNTLLGAEVLDDPAFWQRGREKLDRWLRYTSKSGGVFELNSPVYTPLCLKALTYLAAHTRDDTVALLARLAATRIGLSFALRLHPGTERLCGPYCRAYDVQPYAEHGAEAGFLQRAVKEGLLPAWIGEIPTQVPLPRELVEGFDFETGRMQTSYVSRSFTLGSATTELDSQAIRFIAGQSNVFLMNFAAPDSENGGLVYARYILDEKWRGGFRPTPTRSYTQFLCDEGRFLGVQRGAACIGAYAPKDLGAMEFHHAAKLAIIINKRPLVEDIVIDGQSVDALPADVPEGAVVCFGFGQALLAIRPFTRTKLGGSPPLRIVERDGDLVLEVYNYLGASKTFWELARPGSFYQGQPQCAFYAEAAEKASAGSAAAFCRTVMSGIPTDVVDPLPNNRNRSDPRAWKLGYAREGSSLGLELDLMDWQLLARSADGQALAYQPMKSPAAAQGSGQRLAADGAVLDPGAAALWLYGNAPTQTWVVGGISERPTEWHLRLSEQTLTISAFTYGLLTIRHGEVTLEANPGAHYSIEPADTEPIG